MQTSQVIRPAIVLPDAAAREILTALEREDVSEGGVWNASPSIWQRYDRPWDGPGGAVGSARLIGTVAVVYDTPTRYQITIYRATVTEAGVAAGWSVAGLLDTALAHAGLRFRDCPRGELVEPPVTDPFRRS